MTFNVNKINVKYYRYLKKKQSDTCCILYNSTLKLVIDPKYLGVIINSKLSFNKHIDLTCKKLIVYVRTLSFLQHNLYHCQQKVKIDAYHIYICKAYFRVCSDSLSPHTQQNINKLEGIQHRAVRFVMSDFSTYSSVSTMLS